MAVSESRTGPVGAEKKMSAPKRSSLERSRSEKNMIESRFVGQAQARKTEALRRTDHILSAVTHIHTHTCTEHPVQNSCYTVMVILTLCI